jgi:hypothetical protein
MKIKLFLDLRRKLEKTGTDIERALGQMKGETAMLHSGFTLGDFEALCKIYKHDVDTTQVLKPILDSFETD